MVTNLTVLNGNPHYQVGSDDWISEDLTEGGIWAVPNAGRGRSLTLDADRIPVAGPVTSGPMWGWIATHTGLPSLSITGPRTVTVGARTLCTVPAGQTLLVSDALAVPGVPTEYSDGQTRVILTRRRSPGLDVVADASGRAIPMLRWERDEASRQWSSDVVVYPAGGSRRPLITPARSGSGRFILMDPSLEDEAWRVLQSVGSVIIAAGVPVPGLVPLLVVEVESVTRSMARYRDGMLRFEVTWTESKGTSGAVPVVVWSEWAALGEGWQHRSSPELARLIAGMPA